MHHNSTIEDINAVIMLKIIPIPAFNDNYIWLLHNNKQAYVVDPGDARPVIEHLLSQKLDLAGIIVTHWHADHIGGIKQLMAKYPGIAVIGPNNERIADVNLCVEDQQTISILAHDFIVLSVPGPTMEHIAFYSASLQALFCGDTLFAGGCGRMFEGTAKVFLNSLLKLSQLPENTAIYCAHEYTLANLDFALAVEPDNKHLRQRLQHCQQLRKQQLPTLPSLMITEQQTNPFLRVAHSTVIKQALHKGADSASPEDVFACLRNWKNNY